MNRPAPHRVARLLVLLVAGLSLSACVAAPARPYYAGYWHPHHYDHYYY